MKCKLFFFPIMLLILLGIKLNAQVRTDFNNTAPVTAKGKFNKEYKTDVHFEIPAKNIDVLLEAERMERGTSNETKPFKLAVPVSVDIDFAQQMDWSVDKEYAYSRFTIRLNGAFSASINFDRFYLPTGTEMFVYNENAEMITGPVTENENNSNKIWGSWVYSGKYLTVEIKTPTKSKSQLVLHSNNIAYGYKEIYKKVKVGGFGQSGACNINVVCPLGATWEPERNSVALILSANGQYWCSGSMTMNTCNTNRPFFLTANHCFTGQNVSAWRFTFQAWSPTCTPSQNSDGVTYNGSTLRANWHNSDFCLVELNNTPPTNSGIYYSGWSRSITPSQNGTGIHHPSGDVMKISSANNSLIVSSIAGFPANHHWQVTWSQGVTENGSSGSPIYDQNHRVVGVLTGGPSACGGTALRDYYGRFDVSWEGGGTPATRLSNWLDPNNTGVIATNTTDVTNLQAASLNLSITGDDNICSGGKQYTLIGSPAGAAIIWESSDQNIAQVNGSGTQATVTYVNNGIVIIKATIYSNCFSPNTVSTKITVGTPKPGSVSWTWNAPPNRVMLDVDDVPGATSYQWYLDGVLKGTTAASYYHLPMKGNVSCGNFYYFGVRAINICGVSEESYVGANMPPCGFAYKVFPNPGPGNIQIKPNEDETATSNNKKTAEIQEVELYDKMGIIRHKQKFAKGQTTVNISVGTLRNDVYTLRIFDGETWQSCKIIIQH